MYLSDKASRQVLSGRRLAEFKSWLHSEGLYVFTMNGFPFGGFHADAVKENVYKPDWTTRERVEYTKRLFNILAELVPEGTDGGISTSPVSYKYWFPDSFKAEEALAVSCRHLAEMAAFLQQIEARTGRHLHLDIEPEPDCLIENSAEAIALFKRLSAFADEALLKKHLALCFDICHFSVEYEEPETVFHKLASNGIRIGKIQISAALKAVVSSDEQHREQTFRQLRQFDEARYLHQTVVRNRLNELTRYRDLSFSAAACDWDAAEWRTHFHVPVFLSRYGSLQSTQDDVLSVLKLLKGNHLTNHLEVETYTWDVLPVALKTDLTGSIVRELEWVKKNLNSK